MVCVEDLIDIEAEVNINGDIGFIKEIHSEFIKVLLNKSFININKENLIALNDDSLFLQFVKNKD